MGQWSEKFNFNCIIFSCFTGAVVWRSLIDETHKNMNFLDFMEIAQPTLNALLPILIQNCIRYISNITEMVFLKLYPIFKVVNDLAVQCFHHRAGSGNRHTGRPDRRKWPQHRPEWPAIKRNSRTENKNTSNTRTWERTPVWNKLPATKSGSTGKGQWQTHPGE